MCIPETSVKKRVSNGLKWVLCISNINLNMTEIILLLILDLVQFPSAV